MLTLILLILLTVVFVGDSVRRDMERLRIGEGVSIAIMCVIIIFLFIDNLIKVDNLIG